MYSSSTTDKEMQAGKVDLSQALLHLYGHRDIDTWLVLWAIGANDCSTIDPHKSLLDVAGYDSCVPKMIEVG